MMRWKNRFWTLVLLVAVGGIYSQEKPVVRDSPPEGGAVADPRVLLMQARGTLEGRKLTVRVYPNLDTAPEKYIKVGVLFNNSALQLPAVKMTYPSVSRLSSIFCQAADQTDPIVADALEGFVFLTQYSEYPWAFQWFSSEGNKPFNPYWTFLDARGAPMAGASVDIRIASNGSLPELSGIHVGHTTLDEKGRTNRILSVGGTFVFTVQHPDYGIASVSYMGAINDPLGIYIVPMVPKESPTAARSIQGTVIDNEGRPVKGAYIRCTSSEPSSTQATPKPQSSIIRFASGAITDEKGRFAFSEPIIEDFASVRPAPAGRRYRLEILPPKALNLRQLSSQNQLIIQTATRPTYTLTPMNSGTSFHTFVFKHPDSKITSADELSDIILTLTRDGRQWILLAYPDFKDGYALPSGTLRAEMTRGDRRSSFPEIEISTGSPKQIVFQEPLPITYRGRIIDGATGKPMAGVYVLPFGTASGNPAAWTAQQWQDLQNRAEGTSLGRIPPNSFMTVFLTDAEGFFEARLTPRTPITIPIFTAVAPGYAPAATQMLATTPMSVSVSSGPAAKPPQPDAKGVIEVPLIKMTPYEQVYFPKFAFKDENGSVIDSTELRSVNLAIKTERGGGITTLDQFLQSRSFNPGIYNADAKWNGKYYTFEPVDLTTARPEIVVFKSREVRALNVTYQGQVIHGITREPIWGAVVIQSTADMRSDASQFGPQQWEALKSLGPKPDPKNPSFVRLATLLGIPVAGQGSFPYAVTDREGRFRITVEQSNLQFPGSNLVFTARDFLGLQLSLFKSGTTASSLLQRSDRFKPDKNGIVTLPALSMPPAATIRFRPVVPDTGSTAGVTYLTLFWRIAPEDAQNWFPDAEERTLYNIGMTVPKQPQLRPNVDQTLYIPAGVNLTLEVMQPPPRAPILPINLGPIKLDQGQIKALGRIEFKAAIDILVKVVDENGIPLVGVAVNCVDEIHNSSASTDESGTGKLRATIHSSGKIAYSTVDLKTGRRAEMSIPYQVGGPEDTDKTFTLQIPEAFLKIHRSVTSPQGGRFIR
jgi:hypothetical protein